MHDEIMITNVQQNIAEMCRSKIFNVLTLDEFKSCI